MKKFLVSNFILFSICANAQTMVDTNKVWNVVECLNNFSYCGTNVYYFGSDTTIGPYTYKKFLVNSDSGNLAPPWRPQAVREDTTTKKIYFYTGGDFLAYDFSLNQGDTFNTNFGGCPFFLVVDSVDTVTLLNGEQESGCF